MQLFARALPFKVGKGSRARVSRRGLFKRSQRAPSRKRPVRGRREEARDVSREHGKALWSVVPNCDGKPLKKEGTAVDYMYLFGLWNIAYNL